MKIYFWTNDLGSYLSPWIRYLTNKSSIYHSRKRKITNPAAPRKPLYWINRKYLCVCLFKCMSMYLCISVYASIDLMYAANFLVKDRKFILHYFLLHSFILDEYNNGTKVHSLVHCIFRTYLYFGYKIGCKSLVDQGFHYCLFPEFIAVLTHASAYADFCKKEFHRGFSLFFFISLSPSLPLCKLTLPFFQTYNICFHCSHTNLWICWCLSLSFL